MLKVVLGDIAKALGSILAVVVAFVTVMSAFVFSLHWYMHQPYEFTHEGPVLWFKYAVCALLGLTFFTVLVAALAIWVDSVRIRVKRGTK